MKAHISLFLLIVVFTLLGCKKDDDQHTNPVNQLPPATQTGANTAGCLVNGEPFIPKGYITGGNLPRYYDGENFSLGLIKKESNSIGRSIHIILEEMEQQLSVGSSIILNTKLESPPPIQVGLYEIGAPSPPHPEFYETNDTITGELIITNHDFDNAILSGTFWFDAVNSEGEIVEVREGRFDVKY